MPAPTPSVRPSGPNDRIARSLGAPAIHREQQMAAAVANGLAAGCSRFERDNGGRRRLRREALLQETANKLPGANHRLARSLQTRVRDRLVTDETCADETRRTHHDPWAGRSTRFLWPPVPQGHSSKSQTVSSLLIRFHGHSGF